MGVKQDSRREVISIINYLTESASNWQEDFKKLKERGVEQIELLVCDGLTGIENVIAKEFPKAVVQLCTVHLTRGIINKVKPINKEEIAADLKQNFTFRQCNR